MRTLNSLSDLNISRILRLIWQNRRISRVEIASILKMDKSTVTKIIAELSAMNLVVETESGESGPQGGRKPVFLEINGNFACAGGLEINPERLFCCLTDFQGKVLFEQHTEITPETYRENGFLGFLQLGISILEEEAKKLNLAISGIGLGVPGMIDSNKGKIIQSIPLLVMDSIDVTEEAKKFTKIPVFIDNDARCCCYTEQMTSERFSASKNMMYVFTEYRPIQPIKDAPKNISVGLGLVLNGKIYHGANSAAGEFRSIFWKSTSPTQFSIGENNMNTLDDASITEPMFQELAKNIAFLVNTLTLDVVYVGGLEQKYTDQIVSYIRDEIVYLWPYQWSKTALVSPATFSSRVVAFGAATMVLDKIFCLPELTEDRNGPSISQDKTALDYLSQLNS